MKAKLIVVGGDAKTTEVELKLPATLGRGREATLTLPHPLVSRLHCELYESDRRLFVRDLGSLNGTFINNKRIDGEAELPEGDLLTVGTVTFRSEYDEQAEMRPPEVTPNSFDETINAPVEQTVSVPKSVAVESQVPTVTPPTEQVDDGLDDEDFDGFDDLDFEEIDELGEDEEFHEQNGESHTTEADPVTVTPQPLAETIAESDTASLPTPVPAAQPLPTPAAPVPAAQPLPTPAAPVPTAQPVATPTNALPNPTPPAQGQPLPSPASPATGQSPSAPAIGPAGETQDEAVAESDDDDLNSFLKGLN
jgi:pSer/pThr/pTyr-binding forkhead associated (FHA) protein